MSLLTVRQQFIKISGRYDLATTDSEEHDTDNGSDIYITAGQDYLDRRQLTPEAEREVSSSLAVSGYYVDAPRLIAPYGVWYLDDNSDRSKLVEMDWNELVTEYPQLGSETASDPYNWCCQRSGTVGTKRIYTLPPTNTARTIYVYGRWAEDALTDNDDTNFWSEFMGGLILVQAAIYQMLLTMDNTEGANDKKATLMELLKTVDDEMSLVDVGGRSQIRG